MPPNTQASGCRVRTSGFSSDSSSSAPTPLRQNRLLIVRTYFSIVSPDSSSSVPTVDDTILPVSLTVILGLLFTLAATFVSMALLVRTAFGHVPHAITFLPVPLVFYSLWMSARFADACLRQFVLTTMTPASAMRLVAFVFLAAALFAVGCLYGCVSVVHQLLGGRTARRVRRGAKHVALLYAALLILGWSAYQFQASTLLFTPARAVLGVAFWPLALAAWVWLLIGARSLADAPWRASVERLARAYVALFGVMTVFAAVRDRLWAASPAVPLVVDVFLVLTYTLVTVLWVESAERSAHRASPHQAMP
jgi:hypothetical protein